MDNIRIFMQRIPPLFPVFTGYIDDAPLIQLFPDQVTIQASCTLKLLQYTFFDPGLPYMSQWLKQFGFVYDFTTGIISDKGGKLGNFDLNGGIGHVIYRTLKDIGGWNDAAIHIKAMPPQLIQKIAEIADTDVQEVNDVLQNQVKPRYNSLFTISDSNSVITDQPGTFPSIPSGNVSGVDMAKLASSVGFKGDALVTALAIALRESGWNTDAANYAGSGAPSGATGLWQIAPLDANGNLVQNPPLHSVHRNLTYTNPATGKSESLNGDLDEYVTYQGHRVPAMSTFLDPLNNAKGAYSLYADSGFNPWAINGQVPPAGLQQELVAAQDAVNQFLSGQSSNNNSPNPTGGGPTGKTVVAPVDSSAVFEAYDQGIDWRVPGGGFVYAMGTGKVDAVHDDPGGFGKVVYYSVNNITLPNGQSQIYVGHGMPVVNSGDPLVPGQKVSQLVTAAVGKQFGSNASTDYHTEVGFANGNTPSFRFDGWAHSLGETGGTGGKSFQAWLSTLNLTHLSGVSGGGGIAGTSTTGTPTAQDIAAIAHRAGAFQLQLENVDSTLSNLLTGKRALENDIPLITWINDLTQAAGRVYCSGPNGGFYAFFPDYFGWFGNTPYFKITDLETLNLTINVSDQDLVTHVYGVGPIIGFDHIDLMDEVASTVASVQEKGFSKFIDVADNIFALVDPEAFSNGNFNAQAFLAKYGARPFLQDFVNIRHPVLLWMATWREFLLKWAQRFETQAEFTFLPELFPGGLVNIHDTVQMFINEVTHNFDMQSGFTTQAELIATTFLNNSQSPTQKTQEKVGPLGKGFKT